MNNNKKMTLADIFVSGFALFAMFFGAGNLIFPPFLGFNSSSNWMLGVLCFVVVDIGLGILTIMVIAKIGKGAQGITEPLGKFLSVLILSLTTICLGPLIAIPRTAATTFEFGIAPIFPGVSSWVFSIIFFAIVIVLSIKPSRAVDIIGTVLGPVMLICIIILVIKGVISPLGEASIVTSTSAVVKDGILSGYQTMDMLGALILSVALTTSVIQKGYTTKKQQFKIIAFAGVITSIALFSVYAGLAYLGASSSSLFPATISRSELLISITDKLLGRGGILLLGVIVAFACLTTAIGLLSSAAIFFEEISGGKLKYTSTVILFAVLSCVLSNFGISTIIAFAAPILDLIYPSLVVLIVLGAFSDIILNTNVHKFAVAAAFAVSLAGLCESLFGMNLYMSVLPFFAYGFPWVIPAVILGAIGFAVPQKTK